MTELRCLMAQRTKLPPATAVAASTDDFVRAVPAAPVRVRRRPVLIVVSVASLLLGAFGGVWLWTSATSRVEVIATRTTIERGTVITAADLVTVRMGVDPAVQTVPAADAATVVGKRAALDIAAGGLVTRASITDAVVPPKGFTVVGLALGRGLLPATPLKVGDAVRIVQTPGAAASGQPVSGPVATIGATVVSVSKSTDNQAALVDVLVAQDAAADLAARASAGKVALVLDSRER